MVDSTRQPSSLGTTIRSGVAAAVRSCMHFAALADMKKDAQITPI